jgi:hypothetical protein
VPLRKGAPETGLQVALEVSRRRYAGKLHGDENPPGTMRQSLPGGTFIVPAKSLVDVRGTTDIVSRRIALTPEDVDEALTDAFHVCNVSMVISVRRNIRCDRPEKYNAAAIVAKVFSSPLLSPAGRLRHAARHIVAVVRYAVIQNLRLQVRPVGKTIGALLVR